jgi:hypothetical protein
VDAALHCTLLVAKYGIVPERPDENLFAPVDAGVPGLLELGEMAVVSLDGPRKLRVLARATPGR